MSILRDISGTSNLSGPGGNDGIYVMKLDGGGELLWAIAMGGTGFGTSQDLALDSAGNVHITGQFVGTVDFDPGSGTANLIAPGEEDIFVAKFNASGE